MRTKRLIAVTLMLLLLITGCGTKSNEVTELEKTQGNKQNEITSLDELLGIDKKQDNEDNEIDILEQDDKNEEIIGSIDRIEIIKEQSEDKQTKEIEILKNYTYNIYTNKEIQIDEKDSDRDIINIANEEGTIRYIDIIVENIKNTEPIMELANVFEDKAFVVTKKYTNKIRYTIYLEVKAIENLEVRLFLNDDRYYYRVIDTKQGQNIKYSVGEVDNGDIINIDDGVFIVNNVMEIGSSWREYGEYSEAYRMYRITLDNLCDGPYMKLGEQSINSIKAIDNKKINYEINTDILGINGTGRIEFVHGEFEERAILNKYTTNTEEYIDFKIIIRFETSDEIPRDEINKANTLIKETAHKMFISNGDWILKGYR